MYFSNLLKKYNLTNFNKFEKYIKIKIILECQVDIIINKIYL